MISSTTHFNFDVCIDIAAYDAVKTRQMLFSLHSTDEAMKLAAYRIPKNTQLATQHVYNTQLATQYATIDMSLNPTTSTTARAYSL